MLYRIIAISTLCLSATLHAENKTIAEAQAQFHEQAQAVLDAFPKDSPDESIVEWRIVIKQTGDLINASIASANESGDYQALLSDIDALSRNSTIPTTLRLPLQGLRSKVELVATESSKAELEADRSEAKKLINEAAKTVSLPFTKEKQETLLTKLTEARVLYEEATRKEYQLTRGRTSSTEAAAIKSINQYIPSLISSIESKNYTDSNRAIDQLTTASTNGGTDFTELTVAFTNLSKALAKQEVEEQEAIIAKIDKIKAELPDLLLQSKQTDELDACIAELTNLTQEVSYNNRAVRDELGNMRELANRWQEYLLALNEDDTKKASQALKNASNLLNRTPIIPRSILLTRISELDAASPTSSSSSSNTNALKDKLRKQAMEMISEVKDIEQIKPTIQGIEALYDEKRVPFGNFSSTEFNQLVDMAEAQAMIANQDYANAAEKLRSMSGSNSRSQFINGEILEDQLRLLVLRNIAPDDIKIAPGKAGNQYEFLIAACDALYAQERWSELWQFIQLYNMINNNPYRSSGNEWLRNDPTAIENYLVAMRYIDAEEFGFAWEKLKLVIQSSERYGPVDPAQKAMLMLKEKHLDKMEQQLAEPLTQVRTATDSRGSIDRSYSRSPSTDQIETIVEKKVEEAVEKRLNVLNSLEKKEQSDTANTK